VRTAAAVGVITMVDITREERVARIELDDGDPDDEVTVSANTTATCHYHDSPDCPQFGAADHITMTRRQAHLAERAPCKTCILETARSNCGEPQGTALATKLQHQDVQTLEDVQEVVE